MEKEYDDATVKNLNRGRNYSRFIDSFIEIAYNWSTKCFCRYIPNKFDILIGLQTFISTVSWYGFSLHIISCHFHV